MLVKEILSVYSENHMKPISILRGLNAVLGYTLLKQVVHIVAIGL
jgi:hypothetical protein